MRRSAWVGLAIMVAVAGCGHRVDPAPGPAGTLTGLAKRSLRGIQLVSLKTPDDLEAASALLAEHADSHDDHHAPEWRLVVAPTGGTFRAPDGHPESAGPGTPVGNGTDLGHIE